MNISKLKAVLPNDIFTELYTVLSTRTLTPTQLAQFLANAAHESAGWTKYLENMNYRAERLLVVFPKYFKNLADAKAVVAQGQEAIGNRVYANRMGNNSTNGYFYRGRGVFQLTGKNNYSLFDATVS